MKQTLIFLGLSAVAIAHTGIKSRLAQQASCSCSIPAGTTGAGVPNLTQATYNGFSQGANVASGSSVSTVPDTEVVEAGASECCSCNTGSHSASSSGSKTRHYDITGSISIAESVEWAESGNSSSASATVDQVHPTVAAFRYAATEPSPSEQVHTATETLIPIITSNNTSQ